METIRGDEETFATLALVGDRLADACDAVSIAIADIIQAGREEVARRAVPLLDQARNLLLQGMEYFEPPAIASRYGNPLLQ